MLKICFCAQHAFRFDSNSSPFRKSVLGVAVCGIKGGSSSLSKAQVLSAHCSNPFLCLENPLSFLGGGI